MIRCKICNRKPKEIPEYVREAAKRGITPDVYVMREEGTYNILSHKFYCTDCYIRSGLPSGTA